MKKTIIRMLACCMALALVLTSAFATETAQTAQESGRVKLLAVQGAAGSTQPSELAVVLAMIPALDVDYVVCYDDAHLSVCDLSAAQTHADRTAAMDAWVEGYQKARSRNASHHTLWNQIADLPETHALQLSNVDVLWLPVSDLAQDQWPDVMPGLSQLTACGGTLRLFATADVAQLKDKLATFANVQITAVGDPAYDVSGTLLTEAGYYHMSDAAAKEMMRRTELQPAGELPGESVVINRSARYQLVGSTYTCGAITAGYADSNGNGMAVMPVSVESQPETAPKGDASDAAETADAAAAEGEIETDAAAPENLSASADALVTQIQSEVSTQQPVTDEQDAVIASVLSAHQLCWYFKPAPTLQATLKADPAQIPHSLDNVITVTLTMASASETEAALLCNANLLDEASGYKLTAVLRSASGQETVLALTPGATPGTYQTTFSRPKAGQYAIRATITRTDIPFSYPAFSAYITVEAPADVTAAADFEPVRLVLSPMLWHGGQTEVSISLNDCFNGFYTPVEYRGYNQQLVKLTPAGNDSFTLTALEEGQTQLFLLARDGQTSVVIPVEITNGQKLVLIEAGIALVVILLVVYTVLYARLKQPRFRKGEKLTVTLDGGESFSLPLKSYRASGVTLWRLMVLGARAADYKPDSAQLKRIVFLPRRDQIIVKNDKSLDVMITGQPKDFACGDRIITVALEATDPNA